MEYKSVKQFYFSPTGTTQKVTLEVGRHFNAERSLRDLLREPLKTNETLGADDLAIVGMPVYGGRIPTLCSEMLTQLKGTNTPAIVVVAYGNRDYDDALLELSDILSGNGFLVFAAGAFVARHSLFPHVASERPDQTDIELIAEFSRQCDTKLKSLTGAEEPVQIKGRSPYKKAVGVPLQPSADKRCTSCGVCANVCPTAAMCNGTPPVADKKRCIACAACINACPEQALAFRGIPYRMFETLFGLAFRARRAPQTFL